MDISQQIKKFDAENKPFYMVDHGDGEHSLCLPLSSLKGEYNDFGQEAFNQYAIRAGEPVTDGRFYTHGDGYEWEYVFAKAFEGEENLKKIEAHIDEIVRLAASCNLSKQDIIEMVHFSLEE